MSGCAGDAGAVPWLLGAACASSQEGLANDRTPGRLGERGFTTGAASETPHPQDGGFVVSWLSDDLAGRPARLRKRSHRE